MSIFFEHIVKIHTHRFLVKNLVKVLVSITYDYDLKIVFVTLVINEDIGT